MTPLGVAVLMIILGTAVALYGGLLLLKGQHRRTGLVLVWSGAAIIIVAAVAQPHDPNQDAGSTRDLAAPTNIVSGEHWPCMDGSSGDCLTHEERVDRAQRIAKGLKEASSTITLRDLICANAPTMVICVEAAPEPTQAAPVPLDEYYEQCVAKCEENVPMRVAE